MGEIMEEWKLTGRMRWIIKRTSNGHFVTQEKVLQQEAIDESGKTKWIDVLLEGYEEEESST
jgi:hypothetical protein